MSCPVKLLHPHKVDNKFGCHYSCVKVVSSGSIPLVEPGMLGSKGQPFNSGSSGTLRPHSCPGGSCVVTHPCLPLDLTRLDMALHGGTPLLYSSMPRFAGRVEPHPPVTNKQAERAHSFHMPGMLHQLYIAISCLHGISVRVWV